ncbi:MAG TPA: DUF2948 family protein [candidate division WOR-3 bacterium]|uniref:DUF2948 family protein n=1 Tax=candidate division WOR-3 bacterium TaxID=2052148 RepID=A0A9C9JZQ6_UNCW3|nr:DUF2948 family protein [candidate division WOR-3 bacterium]
MVKILIKSESDLERAADYYHDAAFYLNSIKFDKKKEEFSLKLERVRWEETTVKMNLLFLKLCTAPRNASAITFNKVTNMQLSRTEEFFYNSEPADFIDVIIYHPDKKEIDFKCIFKTVVKLTVKELNGVFMDLNENLGKAHFIYLFGIEIGRH